MAALLDSIVPSRRRERRRLLALEERLNTRFGDPSITAPIEGGWNTFRHDREDDEDIHPSGFAPLSPVVETYQDTLETTTQTDNDDKTHTAQIEQQKESEKQHASLTVTIPLPWRKWSNRASMNHPEPTQAKDTVTSPVSRSQATSPAVVLYKPASEDYRRQLDRSLSFQATSPAVIYKPASEDYKKTLDDLATRPTRALTPIPYESLSYEDDQNRHFSTSTASSHPDSEAAKLDSPYAASLASSDHVSAESAASTPPADHSIPEDVVKGMADFGLCPSPSLRQGVRDRRSASMGAPRSNAYRESVSSSSSGDSGSGGLASPRGLQMATMSSNGGYYSNLSHEYKQIAKTVEQDVVADYRKKAATRPSTRKLLQDPASNPAVVLDEHRRGQSLERRKRQPDMAISVDRAQYPAHDKGRAQSVDRYRTYTKVEPNTFFQDMKRGVSVERPRSRAKSKDRCGPQELVPRADELWG